jgi:hypothetical protein
LRIWRVIDALRARTSFSGSAKAYIQ